jgi:mono/diheme cytochrome c family protein
MTVTPHHVRSHHPDGFRMAIVVVLSAFVLLLLSAVMVASEAQEVGEPLVGQAFAQKVCAECHAVLGSQENSPNPKATPFKVVANTPGMTGTAIAVWLRTPHPTMPNLILAQNDLANLVAYILELRDKK